MSTCPSCGTEIRSVGVGYCLDCGVYTDFAPPTEAAPDGLDVGQGMVTTSGALVAIFPWDELVSVNARSGGMVGWTSKAWRDSLNAMRDTAQRCIPTCLDGPVSVTIYYYPPDRRRRDCHNLDKAILDALIGSAYKDDAQVVQWAGHKMPPSDDPRAVVEVVPTKAIEREAA